MVGVKIVQDYCYVTVSLSTLYLFLFLSSVFSGADGPEAEASLREGEAAGGARALQEVPVPATDPLVQGSLQGLPPQVTPFPSPSLPTALPPTTPTPHSCPQPSDLNQDMAPQDGDGERKKREGG